MSKLYVKSQKCIVCGKCYLNYPEIFDCDDEGIAYVKQQPASNIQRHPAMFECPTKAIQYDDSQQTNLHDATSADTKF